MASCISGRLHRYLASAALGALLPALALCSTGAAAQNAPAVDDRPAAVQGDAAPAAVSTARGQPEITPPFGGVPDIIVTAQKRAQDEQKTAISVGVVTGAELSAQGKNSIEQALRDVPAVQIQRIAQGAQVFIRGVGSGIDPGFADPSVALMADGVYDGRGESIQSGAFDIERVEVLRGPQGTLYGRNATGGVINVITAQPRLDSTDGMVRAQLGNYNLRRIEGAVNVGHEKLAVRIAGFREKRDAYVEGGGDDADAWGVRVKALYRPVDWLTIGGKVEIFRQDGDGQNTVPVPGSAGHLPGFIFATLPNLGSVNLPALLASGWVASNPDDPWSNDPYHVAGYIRRRAEVYQLQVDADLGFGTLTVLPSISRYKNDLSSSYLFGTLDNYQIINDDTKYKSVEARLASPSTSSVKWVVGVYYLRSEGAGASGSNQIGPYVVSNGSQPGTSKALFGQITYPITSSFRVTGGLRYGKDRVVDQFSITNPTNPGAPGQVPLNESTARVSKLTYKAGIEYDVAARSLFYASVSTGYKQGGLSLSNPPQAFKPEKITDYEAGIKNRLFDNRVQFNLGAFYYDYDNYQVEVSGLNIIAPGAFYQGAKVVNADRTHIYGAEAEATWQISRDDQLRGSVTYLHARYGDAVFPFNPFADADPTTTHQIGGEQVANSPTWVGTIGYQHTFNIAHGRITAGFDSRFSSHYYLTPEQYLPGTRQNSYHRTDLNIRYSTENERFSLSGWLKNVEDEAQSVLVGPAYRRVITAPRTYGVTAEAKF